MADAGYDISDYRSIDPVFGTLADADALIAEAHAHGIRIIIDVVPNHCSDRHPLVRRRAGRRARLGRAGPVLVPAAAAVPRGDLPPNNWQSIFGGPGLDPGDRGGRYAWRVVPAPVRARAAGLQLGAAPTCGAEFEDVLRFWFDRGVDGIRIDSAALLTKDADAA